MYVCHRFLHRNYTVRKRRQLISRILDFWRPTGRSRTIDRCTDRWVRAWLTWAGVDGRREPSSSARAVGDEADQHRVGRWTDAERRMVAAVLADQRVTRQLTVTHLRRHSIIIIIIIIIRCVILRIPLLWLTTSELLCLSGGKRGDYQNCSVLYCIRQLGTIISTLRWAVLTVLWIGFWHTGCISLCIA